MKKFIVRDVTIITQFHNAFFQWLQVNQCLFKTPPFEIVGGNRVVRLTIPGMHRALYFLLYSRGIALCYEWQGVSWTLKKFEAFPVATDDGFIDELCCDECPVVYSSREMLWAARVFKPFLDWINRDLTPPRWLARKPLTKPLTEAYFLDNPDRNWRVILPIWTHQLK